MEFNKTNIYSHHWFQFFLQCTIFRLMCSAKHALIYKLKLATTYMELDTICQSWTIMPFSISCSIAFYNLQNTFPAKYCIFLTSKLKEITVEINQDYLIYHLLQLSISDQIWKNLYLTSRRKFVSVLQQRQTF